MSKTEAPVVASDALLAVLNELAEAIDAYQGAREVLQKSEDGSLSEQEAIDYALGLWRVILQIRATIPANTRITDSGKD